MYTTPNFKTKKALIEAIAAGEDVEVYNPGPYGKVPENGKVSLEGPHYPSPHTWYATAILKDGYVIKVI